MRTIKADLTQPLLLGKQGEHGVAQVVFDLSGYIRTYGDGVAQLIVKRPTDPLEYPGVLTRTGNTATWEIGLEWTEFSGQGWCQVNWYTDDDLAKSDRYKTLVQEAMGVTDAPEPHQGYLDQVLASQAKAESAAQQAKDSALETEARAKRFDEVVSANIQYVEDTARTAVETVEKNAHYAQTAEDGAKEAAEQAEAARETCNAAAETAQSAAALTQSYSTHPPIIGENGNWLEWDGTAYVDTGKPSQGEIGPIGPAGPQGPAYELTEADKQEMVNAILDAQSEADDHAKYFGIDGNGVVYLLPEYRGAAYDATYPYAVSDNGTKVAGSKNAELPKHLVIPENINGALVERLANGMFQDNTAVEEVTIPANIVELPEKMCDYALNFMYIHGVENIVEIGHFAFQGTKLRQAVFPKLKTLGENANGRDGTFYNCQELTYVDLGSVTKFSYRTFKACYRLSHVNAPNVTSVGIEAFMFTYRLKNLDFLPRVTSIGNYAFMCSGVQFDWSSLTNCTFGTNATSKQINPTDFWSACTVTANEDPANALPTFLNQSDPRWADREIGSSGLTYENGCVLMSIMHVYCALHDLTLNSVEEFEAIVGADFMNSIVASGSGIAHNDIQPMCEALGMNVVRYDALDQAALQVLFDTVVAGGYAIINVPTSTSNWIGHAVTVYGVRNDKEILIADSGNGCMKYPIWLQNLVKANPASGTYEVNIITGLK